MNSTQGREKALKADMLMVTGLLQRSSFFFFLVRNFDCDARKERGKSQVSMPRLLQLAVQNQKPQGEKDPVSRGNSPECVSRPWAPQLSGKDQIASWRGRQSLHPRLMSKLRVTYKVYFKCSSISIIAAWLPHL